MIFIIAICCIIAVVSYRMIETGISISSNLAISLSIGIFFYIIIWSITTFNKLVNSYILAKNAEGDVQVEFKRRDELLAIMFDIIRKYTDHEKGTILETIQSRVKLEDKDFPDSLLVNLKLYGVMEEYPELKADKTYLKTQEELVKTENRIATALNTYNKLAGNYNLLVQQFPTSFIAMLMRAKTLPFFPAPFDDKNFSLPPM